jgi:ribokinase
VEAVRPVADTATGTALIEVDRSGQNHIVIVPGANGKLDPAAVLPDLTEVAEGDLVLLQLEIPFETVWEVARESHDRGARVILDPAPAAEIPQDVLAYLTWVTPNEHEASIITGIDTGTTQGLEQACSALLEAGVRNVVIKAGARGAMYAHREAPKPQLVPGFPVEAVDTTAAGDSFNGGLAWALSEGRSATEAIRRANAVAALSVTGMGAQTAMPTVEAVRQFLERHG